MHLIADAPHGNPVSDMVTITEQKSGEWSPGLDAKERRSLMDTARDTLRWCAAGRRPALFDWKKRAVTDRLLEKRASFVTFRQRGDLRGCMGTLAAGDPLCKSVHVSAANAAEDPRFVHCPIRLQEVDSIEVRVTVLGPMEHAPGPDAFEPGRHGIVLACRGRRAVFLAEVAVEQGWSRARTLSELCLKAGLPAEAWKDGADILLFESVVFVEDGCADRSPGY